MNFLQQFLKQFKSVLERLEPQQKLVVVGTSLGSIGVLLWLMIWAGQKDYVPLFTNLDPQSAQQIREKLDEQGIPYQLETDGTAILVPEGFETGLRLEMAAEGFQAERGVGYEIFDRPNLGLTDFVQKLNFRRSLEGELARTIRTIEQIDRARVHIVMPDVALFREDTRTTTASIVLTLVAGAELDREQINSISKLVAYSVEGLLPRNVTIVDQVGNDLAAGLNKDPLFLMTSSQLEIQREIENNLRGQIESMLVTAIGPLRSIVRVAVEMDFSQTHTISENFDPASQVVISEDRAEASTGTVDSVSTAGNESSSITNYEVNRVKTETQDDFGRIKRLHVSVTVDTGQTPDQLAALESVISAAVGYNPERGDVVIVREFPLDTSAREAADAAESARTRDDLLANLLRYGLLTVAGIVLLVVLRSVFNSLDLLLPKPKPKPAIDIEAEAIEEEISAEAQRRSQMLDQVAKFAKEKPENVASLLNTWLIEEGQGNL